MGIKWILLVVIVLLWICGTLGLVLHVYHQDASAQIPGAPIGPPTAGSQSRTIETAKVALLMLGGLGVVLPTYLNIWQSLENNKVLEERLRFDKIENSYALIARWDTDNLLKARKFTRELKAKQKHLSPRDLIDMIENDPELKQSLIMVFNFWDGLRISMDQGRVDEDLVEDAFWENYLAMYDRFLPWIRTQSPKYQADLKKLHDMWDRNVS